MSLHPWFIKYINEEEVFAYQNNTIVHKARNTFETSSLGYLAHNAEATRLILLTVSVSWTVFVYSGSWTKDLVTIETNMTRI